jgi:hypothetical protein
MRDPSRRLRIVPAPVARIDILAYAPTEFYHCQHCEIVWGHIGLGERLHREQRASALPDDLQAEYTAISDWVGRAFDRYGERLTVKVIDAASIEGLFKSIRHRARRFPAFIISGGDPIIGFDPGRLDAILAQRFAGTEGGENRTQHA